MDVTGRIRTISVPFLPARTKLGGIVGRFDSSSISRTQSWRVLTPALHSPKDRRSEPLDRAFVTIRGSLETGPSRGFPPVLGVYLS